MSDYRDDQDADVDDVGGVVVPMPGYTLESLDHAEQAELDRLPYIQGTARDLGRPRVFASIDDIRLWLSDVKWGAKLTLYRWGHHCARGHIYAGRASRYAPRGAARVIRHAYHYIEDREGRDVRARAAHGIDANGNPTPEWVRADERHAEHKRWRRSTCFVLLVVAFVLLRWAWLAHPGLTIPGTTIPGWAALAALLAVVILGLIGAQAGDIVDHVEVPLDTAFDPQRIPGAFVKATIVKPPKDDGTVEQARVLGRARPEGDGWYVEVEVPEGTEFSEVLGKQGKLASGLRISIDCLELVPLPTAPENVFGMYIANVHPTKRILPPWPMAQVDRWSLWRGLPIGWDLRSQPVIVGLLWVHTLIGSLPRKGKSTLMRLFCAAQLLDPRAELIIVDFGGGGDFTAFEPYCKQFICGNEDEHVRAFLELLHWLYGEYQRRQRIIREAGPTVAPEGRLTEALAARRMRPIKIVVDEFQTAIADDLGDKVVDAWVKVLKVSPKVGIDFIAATQDMDEKSAPTRLRRLFGQRVALSLTDHSASMVVLGNAAQSSGYDASKLGGAPGYAIAWAPDTPDMDGYRGRLRIANFTPADAVGLVARIANIRRAYTRMTTEMIDDDQEERRDVPLIILDALAAWPDGETACHRSVLAQRMDLSERTLTDQMAAAGCPMAINSVRMRQPVDPEKPTGRGWKLSDLETLADQP